MKVFQISGDWGIDNLRLAERPEPEPQRGEVLVEMRAAALNARDIIVPERGYGRATGELPLIPVSDGVGEVVGVGEGVTDIAVGDRVSPTYFQNWDGGAPTRENFASALGGPLDGVMAERRCLPARGVVTVPDYLTDAEAATLPCAALTAWSALATLTATRPGDRVLIQGTGGVALFALSFAKLFGAHVTVISGNDDKIARVREMGADETVNYRETADWARATRDWTADRGGFDNIVELGGETTLPLSLKAVRPGGTISMIGVLTGLSLNANLGAIVSRQVRLQGVTVGHKAGLREMLAAMDQHRVRPVLGETFGFDQLKEGLEHLRGADRFGKTLIAF